MRRLVLYFRRKIVPGIRADYQQEMSGVITIEFEIRGLVPVAEHVSAEIRGFPGLEKTGHCTIVEDGESLIVQFSEVCFNASSLWEVWELLRIVGKQKLTYAEFESLLHRASCYDRLVEEGDRSKELHLAAVDERDLAQRRFKDTVGTLVYLTCMTRMRPRKYPRRSAVAREIECTGTAAIRYTLGDEVRTSARDRFNSACITLQVSEAAKKELYEQIFAAPMPAEATG